MLSDTLAASGPNDVPTMARVAGIMAIIRMTKGKARIRLTKLSSRKFTGLL